MKNKTKSILSPVSCNILTNNIPIHYPSISELKEQGYVELTSPYESNEKELFHAAVESLGDKHFMIAADRLKRRVIMRKKSDLKLEE